MTSGQFWLCAVLCSATFPRLVRFSSVTCLSASQSVNLPELRLLLLLLLPPLYCCFQIDDTRRTLTVNTGGGREGTLKRQTEKREPRSDWLGATVN